MQTRAAQEGELLILEQKQSKRFYKLFDFVIVYTAQRLDIMGMRLPFAGFRAR